MFAYMKQGKTFYKEVVVLSMPIILQNLITNSLGLVDTFMVGFLGEKQMAAVALANIPVYVVFLLIFGLQSGTSVFVAQFWGKKDMESINRILGIGMYVAGFISILFALITICIPVQFMGLFSNQQENVNLAAQYIQIVGCSYVFTGIAETYIGAHRSMENPKLGMWILTVSMLINVFLNWVLIFGKFGAPRMGVIGAAAATLISRIIEFLITLAHVFFNRRFRLQPALVLRPGLSMFRIFIRLVTPVVLGETLWGLGMSLYPTIMGYMPESTSILAAYAISGNIERVCTVASLGIAGAAGIIIGREIGAGRKEHVRDAGMALNTLAFLAGLIIGVLMLLAIPSVIEPYLYPLFGLPERSGEIVTVMLIFTFAFLPLRSMNNVNIAGVLRGGGDVTMSALIDLLPLWLAGLPAAAAVGLIFRLDIKWVCLCMALENVLRFIPGICRVVSSAWIRDVTE